MTGMHSRTITRAIVAVAQRLDDLEPLGQVLDLLLAAGLDSSWRSFLDRLTRSSRISSLRTASAPMSAWKLSP